MQSKTMMKKNLMEAHRGLARMGYLEAASRILKLLRRGEIRVGLGDEAGQLAEIVAEDCGCRISYSRSYGSAFIRC